MLIKYVIEKEDLDQSEESEEYHTFHNSRRNTNF
jgi:hypothetical protein